MVKNNLSHIKPGAVITDVSGVKGFMIEIYIEPGNQKVGDGVYGKSITDACLGWTESEKLLYDIADLI